ncbi:MAG TPA: hypothetical protein VIT68_04010, partial [Candidatus Gracilibacteria bacterium]
MHTKSPGVSIVIAMGVSLFISSLVLGTMISIGRSFDREVDMGRSLQFYYASESGIESALFHKNARGKGLHLPAQTVSDQALQSLALLGGDINTSWNLEGRASELVGLLEDGRPLEISLFRQIDQSIADTPTSTVEDFDDTLDFEVNFYERSLDMPTDLQNAFTQRFGTVDLKDYPFIKIATDEPYMDWSAKRLGSLGYEIFRPEGDDTGAICPSPTPDGIGFRACKSHVADTNLDIHTLGS